MQKLVELVVETEAVSQEKKLIIYGAIQFRSDIRVEDHSIIDESIVVTTLPGEIAQIINRPVSELWLALNIQYYC